jgi:hypothetical protein
MAPESAHQVSGSTLSSPSRSPDATPPPEPDAALPVASTSTASDTRAGAGSGVPAVEAYDRSTDPVLIAFVRGSVRAVGREWEKEASAVRMAKFQRCLENRIVEIDVLRQLAWSGVPHCFRVCAWQTLLGYLPTNKERQAASISKKKLEYQQCVSQYFGSRGAKTEAEQVLLRQVLVDVPRTFPDIPLFRSDFVQRSLERVLYVWAMRHPASGYVQGINDLATPFYAVFLSPWTGMSRSLLPLRSMMK